MDVDDPGGDDVASVVVEVVVTDAAAAAAAAAAADTLVILWTIRFRQSRLEPLAELEGWWPGKECEKGERLELELSVPFSTRQNGKIWLLLFYSRSKNELWLACV